MTFSTEWEAIYRTRSVAGFMESYVEYMLTKFVLGPQDRVLELGCGVGGNVSYWLRRDSVPHGIDGSSLAINESRKRFPYIAGNFHCGDFTEALPFEPGFDVIFDRASVPHNDSRSIARCIGLVLEHLKPGGLFLGIDWFAAGHDEGGRGVECGELNTRSGYVDGQFRHVGQVHFATRPEIDSWFREFEGVYLQRRTNERIAGNGGFMKGELELPWISTDFKGRDYRSVVWDIVARKPK